MVERREEIERNGDAAHNERKGSYRAGNLPKVDVNMQGEKGQRDWNVVMLYKFNSCFLEEQPLSWTHVIKHSFYLRCPIGESFLDFSSQRLKLRNETLTHLEFWNSGMRRTPCKRPQ